MVLRHISQTLAFICVASVGFLSGESRRVTGEYRNPALGYSVVLPHGLTGITGDQDGPERGVRVFLPSGAVVSIYGEPNNSGWGTPVEGVQHALSYEKCDSQQQETTQARVGSLKAAKGRLVCGDRIVVLLLAFRPGGGPIYWLRLQTTSGHDREDEAALSNLAAGFKLIRWQ